MFHTIAYIVITSILYFIVLQNANSVKLFFYENIALCKRHKKTVCIL